MKLVFICSALRSPVPGEMRHNQNSAKDYCLFAIREGYACFAPHIFYTQFLDDNDSSQRQSGINAGLELLFRCDELWVFADNDNLFTSGMKTEIESAKMYNKIFKRKIIIRYFTTDMKERFPSKQKTQGDINA